MTILDMKIHIFALRWRDDIKRSSQLRTLLKLVVVNRSIELTSQQINIQVNDDFRYENSHICTAVNFHI